MEELPPEDGIQVMRALPAEPAGATPAEPQYRIELHGKKRTWVKIVTDVPGAAPLYDGWLNPNDTVVHVGRRFYISILDKGAVEVFKNGQKIAEPGTDLTVE